MKSGKTDAERKSYVMSAIRQSNKKSWYERQQVAETFEDRMKLHAKYDKFCEGLYDIWLDQYSQGDFYKMIFNILLRENQNSLLARYPNDKDYAERPSYKYLMSNCVVHWNDHNQLGYLVGIMNNYDYQSCEHENYKDSLGHAILNQIRDFLLKEFKLGEIWDFNEWKFIEENKLFEAIS
tara:strand:- start:3 stop:542 length:540 start_codon:yes stop_codon:yes gene_type:complete